MSHNYFGERFAGYKELGWPQLGQAFDDDHMTAEGAAGIADLGFTVSKQPMLVRMPDGALMATDKFMLVRDKTRDDPEFRPFGIVSSQYEFLQRLEIARLLDSTLTAKFPVETAGALDGGKTVFFLLRAGTAEIAKDSLVKYLLVVDRLDGGSALKVANVVVRVVCNNTLMAALESSLATFKITHIGDHPRLLDDRLKILSRVEGSMTSALQRLERLSTLPLTPEQIDRVVAAAFPIPKPKAKVDVRAELEKLGVPLTELDIDFEGQEDRDLSAADKARVFQYASKLNYQRFNDNFPVAAGTGWALYNAIVEFVDFRQEGTDFEAQKSSLFGGRAVEKARALKELELILAGN